ncbi:hypothetical protein SDC9_208975 [bioreactor metagenome]|uniref:Uncharacterized protein n=1 Tax=bioreactor metagenome TaxID=1076179 RepID=A0A645JC57_9ZZZZ
MISMELIKPLEGCIIRARMEVTTTIDVTTGRRMMVLSTPVHRLG